MTSNGTDCTVTREILTAVARDQRLGALMLSLESQCFRVISARKLARARTQRKKFYSS